MSCHVFFHSFIFVVRSSFLLFSSRLLFMVIVFLHRMSRLGFHRRSCRRCVRRMSLRYVLHRCMMAMMTTMCCSCGCCCICCGFRSCCCMCCSLCSCGSSCHGIPAPDALLSSLRCALLCRSSCFQRCFSERSVCGSMFLPMDGSANLTALDRLRPMDSSL